MSIVQYVLLYNSCGDGMDLRIRDLREDGEYSQKFIAEYLMCDQSLYSKYERGEREIPLRLILKLAELYGVSLDYLVRFTDDPSPRK